MRKTILFLLVGFFSASVLVAAPQATAADPYPGTVITNCKVRPQKDDVRKGRTNLIKAMVNVPGSKAKPKGKMTVVVKRIGGGYKQKFKKNTRGKLERFRTKKLVSEGTYRVILRFRTPKDSVFQRCTEKAAFVVD